MRAAWGSMPLAVLAAALLLALLHGPLGAHELSDQATVTPLPPGTSTPAPISTTSAPTVVPTAEPTQIAPDTNEATEQRLSRRALVQIIFAASVAIAGLLLVFQGQLFRLGSDLRDQVKDISRPGGIRDPLGIWAAVMGLIAGVVFLALLVAFMSVLWLVSNSSVSLGFLDNIASRVQPAVIISFFLFVIALVAVLCFLVPYMFVSQVESVVDSSASDNDSEGDDDTTDEPPNAALTQPPVPKQDQEATADGGEQPPADSEETEGANDSTEEAPVGE